MRRTLTGAFVWIAVGSALLSPAIDTAAARHAGATAREQVATLTAANRFGVHFGSGRRTDAIAYVTDLGATWVRLNSNLSDPDPDFKGFLDAGINLVITFNNQDPSNIDTTYGTPDEWIHAGFPFRSRSVYQQRIHDELAPLVPYLATSRQIWVQCENEIGDAQVNSKSPYWRGTTDQYLTLLDAMHEAVKSLDSSMKVVLTSFASQNLDAAVDPSNPTHSYQTQRMTRLLNEGKYDAADLHFYGCIEGISARAEWTKDHMPSDRLWISTENSGPDPFQCASLPVSWQQDLDRFEQVEAQQVSIRLTACADSGASICLWFSLFDLRGEVDEFNHLGLLDSREMPARKKPAYSAFKTFAASVTSAPTLSSVQILRKGNPVDHPVAGTKTKLYQISVSGGGFTASTRALVDGADAETTFVSATTLAIKLPGKRVPAEDSMTVQARNADGEISNLLTIEVRPQ